MIKNYFLTAWRNLVRNKVYSVINIAGLSLGLSCAMLILLYVKDEVSFDRWHKNVDRIYRVAVGSNDPRAEGRPKMGITGMFQGPKFAAKIPGIEAFVRVGAGAADIRTKEGIQSQSFLYTDPNFFSVFSFPFLSGDPKTVLKQAHGVVLSADAAKRQFGTVDAVGKILYMKDNDQFIPYTVTGVAKNCPQNSSIKFEVVRPLTESKDDENRTANWYSFFLATYVVMAPHSDVKAVEEKMVQVYREDAREMIADMEKKYKAEDLTFYSLQPFTAMHLGTDVSQEEVADRSNPVFSYILSGIAIFVLLIACINFINLTIARSLKRAKEIGIRKVLGVERKQLIAQFLGEAVIVCFASFAAAILLVEILLPVFNELANKALSLSYLFDVKLIMGYAGLFLVTAFLAGFYPALVMSDFNPVRALYNRWTFSGKNYLQKGLVILQFALASFLIIATFTIYSQFNYLTTEKLGYDDSHVVVVIKDRLQRKEASLLKAALMKSPDILSVASRDNDGAITGGKVNGDSGIVFAYETIDESYLPLMKIPIIKGRYFSERFPSDSVHSVIVNECFVKTAHWKNPIGQEVNFNGNEKYTVVGVVKDYHYESLNVKIMPELLTMRAGNDYGAAYIKIRPNSETASLHLIQQTFRQLFPVNPFSYVFKDLQNRQSYEAEAKWKQIILFGAVLTIFVSCIGLFGLSVLAAERRTKEIGIRKVLGASVRSVVGILSEDFLKLVAIALLVAVPLSRMAAGKWLEKYPYRVSLSWWMFAVAGVLVVLIALVTVSFQAIRAGMANPVKSLRTE